MSTNREPGTEQDLIEAAKSGDRLRTLIALRDLLAERLQNTQSSRDISSISRRLMQCVSEIEILEREKRAAEEHPVKLSEFRQRLGRSKKTLEKQYELNDIAAEHERS